MKHSSSQALFAYWDTQRGARVAPERADIDPAAIRHILADTFVLAADFTAQNRFRLAGTKVCSLFGRELKDEAFTDLWCGDSRHPVSDLLDIVNDEMLGVVVGVTGATADGEEIELEMLMLPMARRGHARVRALGVLAPLTLPYWLGSHPVRELRLGALRHLGAGVVARDPQPLQPALTGRPLPRGFVVYEGGRGRARNDTPPAA